MSEDCLTLNVFTPACDGKKRPVAVWIHGGAYLTGSACDPGFFPHQICAEQDVVNVTIQYRLGALGCVDFSGLSGAKGRFDANCGTWDQVAAVNWVMENIEAFGGNPKEITLMGGSAGGTSVLTLITTPYLKGKIRQAVMESPAPWLPLTREGGRLGALKVLEELGLGEDEVQKILDIPADRLAEATNAAEYKYYAYRPYTIPTGPVVDGDLIPELPFDAVMHGAADEVDVLIGSTADEATLFANPKLPNLFPIREQELEHFFKDHPEAKKGADPCPVPGLSGYQGVSGNRKGDVFPRRNSSVGGISGAAHKCLCLLRYLLHTGTAAAGNGSSTLHQYIYALRRVSEFPGMVCRAEEQSLQQTASGSVGQLFSAPEIPVWRAIPPGRLTVRRRTHILSM